MHGHHVCGHSYECCTSMYGTTHGYFMHVACVAPNKLHKMCMQVRMFHAMRKHGLRKHVTGLFKVLSCYHMGAYVYK